MSNAIEIHDLCKTYPGFSLKSISFTVPQGLCCGFVGPNGAGKSTTLRMLAGLAFPDSGDIRLLGRPVGDSAGKGEIGILFDQPYYQEEWTPLDIERSLAPFYPGWDSARYRNYLSRFGLDARKKFRSFSRGMKQKLAMAVHLSRNTRLLLLDEPTGGLDPAARDELLDILREYMVPENRTILFSTHITSDLERLADRIVYISGGAISYSGDTEELVSRYCVVRGNVLPEGKKDSAIGLRQSGSGYECLMELARIGGLPPDAVTEPATIGDVVVYMERNKKNA
nr:ABC transporter ATP-binding protein [uncultured Acetatifactor sp.]